LGVATLSLSLSLSLEYGKGDVQERVVGGSPKGQRPGVGQRPEGAAAPRVSESGKKLGSNTILVEMDYRRIG
jgi:hypothetical protein